MIQSNLLLWMHRHKVIITLASSILIGIVILLPLLQHVTKSSASAYEPSHFETARSADSFVDSIGVATHLESGNAYSYGDPWEKTMKPMLVNSGIRHISDGAVTYSDDRYYARLRDLAAKGIRFNLGSGVEYLSQPRWTDFSKLGDVYRMTNGAIDSFSGLNEPVLEAGWPDSLINGQDWPTITRRLQKQLYDAVKGNPQIAQIPVLGPSMLFDNQKLGDISSTVDYGNLHHYATGGECPGCAYFESRTADERIPTGDKPYMITETGYHNGMLADKNGFSPITETTGGKYIPRSLFYFFNLGSTRTYAYEFLDDESDPALTNQEKHFGMVRADGTPKPSYNAVKNIIGVLSDKGSAFTPGKLHFNITGNTDGVQHTLLQKRDGSFYLALWVEKSSYYNGINNKGTLDIASRADIKVPSQRVTVDLSDSITHATTYNLDLQGNMSSTATPLANHQITLNVPDQIQLVKLDSKPTSPAPTGGNKQAGSSFDRWGNSYSLALLKQANLVAQQRLTFANLTFTWPDLSKGQDKWKVQGQQISFNKQGRRLGFLGASSDGPASGWGKIYYTDGTTQDFQLTLTDWTLNGGTSRPVNGNLIVAQMAYRLGRGGVHGDAPAVFFTSVDLNTSKTVDKVVLPTGASQGTLNIFATAIG